MRQQPRVWMRRVWLVCACVLAQTTARAGLLLGDTRIIYTEGEYEQVLMLANTDDDPLVVQTWVDDGRGDPDTLTPFMSLPSVFSLPPKARQAVRVLLDDAQSLPQDRESVFWLNLYAIPPTLPRASVPASERLTLALNTQLKIFYRPAQLPAVDVGAQLRFSLLEEGGVWQIECENPTPYHASLTALRVGNGAAATPEQNTMDRMIAPFSRRRYLLNQAPQKTDRVHYTLIGEKGFAENFQKHFLD